MNEGYWRSRVPLQQKLETVAKQLCCRNLLFNDSNLLSKALLHEQNINCVFPIRKGYYNNSRRQLQKKDVYDHCGTLGALGFVSGMKS
jgi:hypothetical protein